MSQDPWKNGNFVQHEFGCGIRVCFEKVEFSDGFSADSEEMKKVQERAHRYCFIANSLSDEVKVIIS